MCWADRRCFQMMFHTVSVDLSEQGKVRGEQIYLIDSFGMFLQNGLGTLKIHTFYTVYTISIFGLLSIQLLNLQGPPRDVWNKSMASVKTQQPNPVVLELFDVTSLVTQF